MRLDPASISALAAIFGSLTGAFASSVSTWITQRHQDRRGPTRIEVQSDEEGNFSFDSIIPGDYAISAEAPGMAGTRNLVVQAGTVSEVSLEMKLVLLAESWYAICVCNVRGTEFSVF